MIHRLLYGALALIVSLTASALVVSQRAAPPSALDVAATLEGSWSIGLLLVDEGNHELAVRGPDGETRGLLAAQGPIAVYTLRPKEFVTRTHTPRFRSGMNPWHPLVCRVDQGRLVLYAERPLTEFLEDEDRVGFVTAAGMQFHIESFDGTSVSALALIEDTNPGVSFSSTWRARWRRISQSPSGEPSAPRALTSTSRIE